MHILCIFHRTSECPVRAQLDIARAWTAETIWGHHCGRNKRWCPDRGDGRPDAPLVLQWGTPVLGYSHHNDRWVNVLYFNIWAAGTMVAWTLYNLGKTNFLLVYLSFNCIKSFSIIEWGNEWMAMKGLYPAALVRRLLIWIHIRIRSESFPYQRLVTFHFIFIHVNRFSSLSRMKWKMRNYFTNREQPLKSFKWPSANSIEWIHFVYHSHAGEETDVENQWKWVLMWSLLQLFHHHIYYSARI